MMRRIGPVTLVLALLAGCAPGVRDSIGVRERPVNIKLGEYGTQPAPAPTLGVPTSGGFITGPTRIDHPYEPPDPPPQPECPEAPAGTPAEAPAPTTVTAAPKPGLYRYTRTGTLRVGDPGDPPETLESRNATRLSSVLLQEITNVAQTEVPSPENPSSMEKRITFDVVQTEPGIRTTTSYLIDPIGVATDRRTSGGLKITKIVLERTDLPGQLPGGAGGTRGIEVFEPQPPVKIISLPAQSEPPPFDATFSSDGNDARSGAAMHVFAATQARENIDICGRVIQAWRVKVSFPDAVGGPFISSYDRTEVRSYTITGSFVFAPQFSLIVAQNFTFEGVEVGQHPFQMISRATIQSVDPA